MKSESNQEFWQRCAGLYGPVMDRSSRLYEEICARIRPWLSREQNVLELACGTGQLSFRLAGRVQLWEATDFSPEMIRRAQGRAGSCRLHFSVQDATCLPYADGSFDAVVVANALHIMPHPEQALAEIRRVLKPGGLLFAPTFLHGKSAGFRLRVFLMERVGFHTFFHWEEPEFLAFLEQNGFAVQEHSMLGGSLTPLCHVRARPIAGA